MFYRKLICIIIAILSALLLISLFSNESNELLPMYKRQPTTVVGTIRTAKPKRNIIQYSRAEWKKIIESRNRTEENMLWPSLHKPQTQNTGFIHLYQQMITGGPFGDKRHQEIRETIQYNIDHIHVRYLYMAEETGNETRVYKEHLKDPLGKVRFIPFGRQSNYSDVFAHIMKHIFPYLQKDDVWMFVNSDIALGEGFDMIKGNLDSKTVIMLSRYDKFCTDSNMCYNSGGGSTDCVLGNSEVKEETYKHYNFKQYARGGENEIMRFLKKAGFTVIDPCIDIKTYHNHCSNDRSWGKDKREWKRVDPVTTRSPVIRWSDYIR